MPINAPIGPSSSSAVATTSGTLFDFPIPSTAKRITVMFNGVSTNGTAQPIIQIGSGSVDITGYNAASGRTGATAISTSNYTTGFGINSTNASNVIGGSVVLTLLGNNVWSAAGTLGDTVQSNTYTVGGNKTLSGTLDRVRITTGNGTDTFDGGSINVMWE